MTTSTTSTTNATSPAESPASRATPAAPTTAAQIAELVSGELRGDAAAPATAPTGLDEAEAGQLTFIRSRRFAQRWADSAATTAVVSAGAEPEEIGAGRAIVVVDNADVAMVRVLEAYAPRPAARTPGIHPTAAVDPTAEIGQAVHIGPGCVVEAGASIGDGSVLVSNCHVGVSARIGRGCTLHPGAALLDRCVMGDLSVLHAGAAIGGDGFGYVPDPATGLPTKLPHIGNVEIGNMVEIGPNTCVDRGKFGATRIGDGTKVDNLVQIGHNVTIGRACIICALCGIAGSVRIGDGVTIAAQVGINDGVTIGNLVQIGGQSGVVSDVPDGARILGTPAISAATEIRNWSAGKHLWSTMRKLKKLEDSGALRLDRLETFQRGIESRGAAGGDNA